MVVVVVVVVAVALAVAVAVVKAKVQGERPELWEGGAGEASASSLARTRAEPPISTKAANLHLGHELDGPSRLRGRARAARRHGWIWPEGGVQDKSLPRTQACSKRYRPVEF